MSAGIDLLREACVTALLFDGLEGRSLVRAVGERYDALVLRGLLPGREEHAFERLVRCAIEGTYCHIQHTHIDTLAENYATTCPLCVQACDCCGTPCSGEDSAAHCSCACS